VVPEPRPAPLRTILIAHGDADSRALFRAMLEHPAYVIEECEDGAEALGKVISGKPDLLIAASHLARIDGMALCRLLRSDPHTRSMGIVLIPTGDGAADAVRAKAAGADATLAAPCAPEAVVAAIHGVIEQPREPVAPPRLPPLDAPSTLDSPRRSRTRNVRPEQTTMPPLTPPSLHCPSCQSLLTYQHSQTGGVNERSFEQWDYFRCPSCGPYQYRHRTRKLRAT